MDEPRIAIIGGGVAGAATALALRQRGVAVTIVERSPNPGLGVGEQLRADGVTALRELGAGELLEQAQVFAEPHGTLSWWGSDVPRISTPLFGEVGRTVFRPAFDRALLALAARRGVEVCTANVQAIQRDQRRWTLSGPGCDAARAFDFLVDASGRRALVVRALGLRRCALDKLVALVGRCELAQPHAHDERLLLEATPEGWWYSVRTPDGALVAAAMTDHDLGPGLPPERSWWLALDAAPRTGSRVARTRGLELVVRSARTEVSEAVGGEGWLAVGDAAASWDPLSSAGMTKALRSAAPAAESIVGVLAGERRALERYSEQVCEQFSAYVRDYGHYYGLEQRWPGSPFWTRRAQARASRVSR